MTPEAMKMRNAITAVLADQLGCAPTPARRAADAVMDALPQFFGVGAATRRENPEHCGQRHVQPSTNTEYRCSLAVGHHGGCHMDIENNATWTGAGDLVEHSSAAAMLLDAPRGPVGLQHDACGALLSFQLHNCQPVTLRCALGGPTHPGMRHRAADGTQWDTATPVVTDKLARLTELERLAAPSEDGALQLGPVIERQRAAAGTEPLTEAASILLRASQRDVMPLVREVMRLRRVELQHGFCAHDLEQMRAQRDEWRNMHESARPDGATLRPMLQQIMEAFAELHDFLCTGCRPVAVSSNPEDGADLETVEGCPVHGEVAELRRSLAWAAGQHERIALALGPEYAAPFGADAAQAAVNCIKTARGIDAVLREAGIEPPLGLRGVEDLANRHDAALEHVTEIRNAVRAEIIATVHQGHSADLDDCTHHACVGLRRAVTA